MSSTDRGAMSEGSDRIQEAPEADGFVAFLLTGEAGAGEFRCSRCGYGVIVQLELPRCPMCSGTSWEEPGWGAMRRRAAERLR
jgi:rubrerythrin